MTKKGMRVRDKATNLQITTSYLDARAADLEKRGYGKSKWIMFCERMIAEGATVRLYEARQTFSKYVTVSAEGRPPFKVRFSNHRPIKAREIGGDCDFFVGVTNLGVTTTEQAIAATISHLFPAEVPA